MKSIGYIKHNNRIIAIVIPNKLKLNEKIHFLTKNSEEFQIAVMNRSTKDLVKPHFHPKQKRILNFTSELILILKGKVKINFFASLTKKKKINSKILKTGDAVCFLNCGHSLEFIVKTKILEVKQGPYINNKDKVFIKS